MSSNINIEEHNPVANLAMQPTKGILKTSKSIDEDRLETEQEVNSSLNNFPITGMTRSESKSHKIPHFDEMNIIATYHPVDKDYGHMKIEEPKTPYALGDIIDEEMDTEHNNDEASAAGIDPDALVQRLNESSTPSPSSSRLHINRPVRRSIDDTTAVSPEELEHRKQFENHRKQHYNEFEVVRLHKKEIEAELRALEQEEAAAAAAAASGSEKKGNETILPTTDQIKPILVHHSSSSHHQHHIHVEDDHEENEDERSLTPEERERKRQFELKRKKHYNEFRTAHSAAKKEDEK